MSSRPTCDLVPMEFNVVVEIDAPQEKIGSILLPPSVLETEKTKAEEGWLVAVSPHAFNYADWDEGMYKPKVGDRVLIGRYTGITREKDGVMWRILKDKDIIAVIEPEFAEVEPLRAA